MELIVKVTAVCLVGALLAVLLKKSNPELALLLALAACVIVLAVISNLKTVPFPPSEEVSLAVMLSDMT